MYVVFGLGKTGFSCVRFLRKQGIEIAVIDTRDEPPLLAELQEQYPEVEVYLGGIAPDPLRDAEVLVVSPGIDMRAPEIQCNLNPELPVWGDVELFAQYAQAPIVAITGSNAKSTVTSMVGEIMSAAGVKAAIGGNLGVPALDLLSDDVELYVLEISSFQLETCYSLQAKVASILNISPDHLDRYTDYQEYIATKQRVYHGCELAVCNRTDSNTWPVGLPGLSFGLDVPADGQYGVRLVEGVNYLACGEELLLPVAALAQCGSHQWENALAAMAIAHAVGVEHDVMLPVLKSFAGLPYRCQRVLESDGVVWYNDSKGTNVGATMAAIQGIAGETKGSVVLLAGGQAKQADFSELVPAVKRYVSAAILFGEDRALLESKLREVTTCFLVDDLAAAIVQADQLAKLGDAVLFSPACASFDMFDNYVHRGEVYADLVKELLAAND